MQIDMFQSEDMQKLSEQVEKIKVSTGNVQRGIFARHTSLEKYFCQFREETRQIIEEQQREIYKLKKEVYRVDKDTVFLEMVK